MPAGLTVNKMIAAYYQAAANTAFLTGMFATRPENLFNGPSVEFDVQRSGEQVAIVVQDLTVEGRSNSYGQFVNKAVVPPIFREIAPISVYELMGRLPGVNPYQDAQFQANATFRATVLMRVMQEKIDRAKELMAAQVLQTGTITQVNSNGDTLYTIDYAPKATHFPTVSIDWGTGTEDMFADLDGVFEVIRQDGHAEVTDIIAGKNAWFKMLANAAIRTLLDNRRMELGLIAPSLTNGVGGTLMGRLQIGTSMVNVWTYNGFYQDPVTGDNTPFLDPDKVICIAASGRKEWVFGAIPRLVPPDQRLLPFLPTRFSNAATGSDMFPYAWLEPNGSMMTLEVASRPLPVPIAIDTYGCLDTVA